MADLDLFDIAIIGGGVNGCGIARDAAGRGHRVFLCDKGDLAAGTSSASTKLIHGGLRYLEHYEFRLVREALLEREVLWGIAPHIIWPLRFVLPHHKRLRPAWLLRLGLFLYDHMGARKRLPPTRTLRLQQDRAVHDPPAGNSPWALSIPIAGPTTPGSSSSTRATRRIGGPSSRRAPNALAPSGMGMRGACRCAMRRQAPNG